MKIILGYIITYCWVFLTLGLAAVARKIPGTDEEIGRKIVHCLAAFAFFPMMYFFGSSIHLIIPPLTFVALNYLSVKKDLFSMMERHDDEKKSYGTVYYALSMALMAAAVAFIDDKLMLPFGAGMLCMALGDGFAPFFGRIKKGNHETFGGRTLYGSISVFAISLIVIFVFKYAFGMSVPGYGVVTGAFCACILELFAVKGLDNITLPIGVCIVCRLFMI